MKKLIEVQMRLLFGTATLLLISSLLFGEALVVTGVATVIRWMVYIVGASLVITSVGWVSETIQLFKTFMMKVLEMKPPKLGVKDFLQEVRQLLARVSSNGSITEYVCMQFNELLEVSEIIVVGPFRSPVEELNHRFNFHLENVPSKITWEEVEVDGRLQRIAVLEATTLPDDE